MTDDRDWQNRLSFWDSREWKQLQEKLNALEVAGISYNPKREDIFAALDAVPFKTVRVCILGQDPYPDHSLATGIAFSIPREHKKLPPTLINIFKEYVEDLHYPWPSSGDLTPWCEQGVLLYNVYPTCTTGVPASHRDWREWYILATEIIGELNERGGCVFVGLGSASHDYLSCVDSTRNDVITVSHPSPRGAYRTFSPFMGSRIFTTINSRLCQRGKQSIDWRLD